MSIQVLTPSPTKLLTTLDTVKLELGLIDVDTDDVMLDRLITRASDAIARECARVFGKETVAETLQGSNTRLLGLTRRPILSVTEVLEDSVLVPSSEYTIEDADAGALYRATGWAKGTASRMWGQEAFSSGYILPGTGTQNFVVTYIAGYDLPPTASPTLPGDVEQACIETVRTWYASSSGAGGMPTALQLGNLRVQYGSSSATASTFALPQIAKDLLRNYRGSF